MRTAIVLRAVAGAFLLAGSAGAQSDLVGTWTHTGSDDVTKLFLLEDGTAQVESTGTVNVRDEEDESTHTLPEKVTVEVIASGTWRVEEERLFFTLPERELRIDGKTFDEALTELATLLAMPLAETLGVGEAGLPNLIAIARLGLAAEYNEDELLDEAMGDLTAGQPYRVEGDILWLTDGEGVETSWYPAGFSAVAPEGWAAVKASAHPAGR